MSPALTALLLYASQATGYALPASRPTLIPVSHEFFLQRPECHQDPDCSITGLFVHGDNVVYVQRDLKGVVLASTLVHELTHFLQAANGRYLARTCANLQAREAEAYRVADAYLNDERAKAGLAPWVWDEEPVDCGSEPDAATR